MDINLDTVEEIFFRLPLASVLRLQSDFSLLKTKRFITNLVERFSSKPQFLTVNNGKYSIVDPESGISVSTDLPHELGKYNLSHGTECDGIILCSCLVNNHNPEVIAVWNPFLKKVKLIKSGNPYLASDVFGLGYSRTADMENEEEEDKHRYGDFKIIRVRANPAVSCEVYSFLTGTWKIMDTVIEWKHSSSNQAVSLRGNSYWIVRSWKTKSHEPMSILKFDFSSERFGIVSQLPHKGYSRLSVYRKEFLSVLYQEEKVGCSIEVWIFDIIMSTWSKKFSVCHKELPCLHNGTSLSNPLHLLVNNELKVWVETDEGDANEAYWYSQGFNHHVYIINGDGCVKELTNVEARYSSGLKGVGCLYYPSLVDVE